MPNYCENLLNVNGPMEDINKLKQAAFLNDEYYFSAEKLLPTPQELLGTRNFNPMTLYQLKHLKSLFENEPPQCVEHLLTLENEIEAVQIEIDNYQQTWETWRLDNWGTKSDLYLCNDVVKHEWLKDIRTELPFDSSWIPPVELFDYVSKQFPSLEFKLAFFEPENNFYGYVKWEHGERVDGEYNKGIIPMDWAIEHFNCTEDSYNEMMGVCQEDEDA